MKKEKWAFVTGSSDGIGKSIALELDSKGYNLILHGRDKEKIKEVSSHLKNTHKEIILDLNKKDAHQEIINFFTVNNLELEILVNNAGFGVFGDFKDSNTEEEINLIQMQISFTIYLTKYFINKTKKRPFYILNVSSLYSFFPVPKQSVYAASKAFLHSFSLALYYELKGSEIYVSDLCPGLTKSNFRQRQGKKESFNFFILSATRVAREGVRGLFKKNPVIIPGLVFKIMVFTIPKLPSSLRLYLIYKMNSKRGF